MPKTFHQMVAEAAIGIPRLSPHQVQARLAANQHTLLIEVRDAEDLRVTGIIPGAAHISAGMLAVRADLEVPEDWRNPLLADRSRPIIVTCGVGLISALAARTLLDMGFSDVSLLDGGTRAWCDAGLPTVPPLEL